MANHDRLVKVVDAGSKYQVLAVRERSIDRPHRRTRGRDEEFRERDRRAGFTAAGPGWPSRVVLQRWHEDAVSATGVGIQERLFLGHRARRQYGVLRAGTTEHLRRGSFHAREDVVPQAASVTSRRSADIAV